MNGYNHGSKVYLPSTWNISYVYCSGRQEPTELQRRPIAEYVCRTARNRDVHVVCDASGQL